MKSYQKFLIYLAGIVLPPSMLAIVSTLSALSQLMMRTPPPPLSPQVRAELPIPIRSLAERPAADRLLAVFILGPTGTQITDLLAPLEILSYSDRFEIRVIGPKREAFNTTGGVSIIPRLFLE
jgi:hypothetical protein